MKRALSGFLAGFLFGGGLLFSGMINPAKVVGFLDVAGEWDPSLAFVMLGGVIITAFGYRAVLLRGRPIFESAFALPAGRNIDPPLLLGSALFGVGWGLGGYCPGPALAGLGFGRLETIAFVAAMLAGMVAARQGGGVLGGLVWRPRRVS